MLTVKLSKSLEKIFAFSTGATERIIPVWITIDTAALAAADVMSLPHRIPNAVRHNGGVGYLTDVRLYDPSDQGLALDIHFSQTDTPLGTVNSAISWADDDIYNWIGKVAIASTDWSDFINSRAVDKHLGDAGSPATHNASPTSRDIWATLVLGGTGGTFAAGKMLAVFCYQDAVRGY